MMLLLGGSSFWTTLTADISRSNSPVFAQTPTPVKKPAFEEDISLQFYVAQDYTIKVEGVIELTNSSGKDISLTEYGMNLPYFTLKDTKIGYIYPKAFLVDMYSQNNSILFTFKSQFTRPVVIGKNGKITFTFSADVEKPYRDIGGLRTLSFPFTLNDEGRSLRITVTVNDKAALIYAPNVAQTLKKKNIYTVTDETGKLFLFATSEKPFSIALSHTTEVALPQLGSTNTCSTFLPVSCVGCGNIAELTDKKEIVAQREKGAENVIVQFTKSVSPTCAIAKYQQYDISKAQNSSFGAGYVISPSSNQLIPAMWRIVKNGDTEYIKDVSTQGVPYVYADAFGYLSIPLQSCSTDDECRIAAEKLRTIDTSLTTTSDSESPGIINTITNVITSTIKQEGRRFTLLVKNNSSKFVQLSALTLEANPYFTLTDTTGHYIPPQSEISFPLDTKVKIQTSNHDAELIFSTNNDSVSLTFKPITITILAVIEILAYLFVVSLGITTVSVSGLILYNRLHGKAKK